MNINRATLQRSKAAPLMQTLVEGGVRALHPKPEVQGSAAQRVIRVMPAEVRRLTIGYVAGRKLIERLEAMPEAERPQQQVFQLCTAVGALEQFLLTVATPRQS